MLIPKEFQFKVKNVTSIGHLVESSTKRTREGTSSANRNNKDRNTPMTAKQRA